MADTIFANKYERREFTSTSAIGYSQNIAALDEVVLTASQTINDDANTKVVLPGPATLPSGNATIDGSGNVFISVRGIYHISAFVSWNGSGGATNGNRGAYLVVKNAGGLARTVSLNKQTAAGGGLGFKGLVTNVSYSCLLEIGDAVELWVYQSNGTAVDIYGVDTVTADTTSFFINKI